MARVQILVHQQQKQLPQDEAWHWPNLLLLNPSRMQQAMAVVSQ
jgi:hypothetical protein